MSPESTLEISNFLLSSAVIAHATFILNIISSGLNNSRARLVILLLCLVIYPASTYIYLNSNIFFIQELTAAAGISIGLAAVYFFHHFPRKQKLGSWWLKLFYFSGFTLMILSITPGFWPGSHLEGNLLVADESPLVYFLGIYTMAAIILIILNTYKSQSRSLQKTKRQLFYYFISFTVIATTLDVFIPIGHPTIFILSTAIASSSSIIFSLGLYQIFRKDNNVFSPHSFTQLLTTFLVLLIVYSFAISYTTNAFIRIFIISIAIKVGYDTLHQIKLEHTEHAELEQKHLANMEYISDIAHRLKTPLAIIEAQSSQDKSSLQTLQDINRVARTTAETLHNIVQIGKIDASLIKLSVKNINLTEQLSFWKRDLSSLVQPHPFQLKMTDEVWIRADINLLREAVFNLLDNASKFSPKEKPVVVRLTKSAGVAKLSVQDFGIGLRQQEIGHIFDRHWQGGNQPKQVGSAGLGLALVKWVVQQHRGEIKVTSIPKLGTTFTIKLPAITPNKHSNKVQKIIT